MIEFNNVSKTYPNGTKALKNLNIKIDDGEFVFVLGASGAGKSTFLKLVMREETATEGEVIIGGENLNTMKNRRIPYYRRKLGIVFQDFRLIPKMKVYDNVAFAMRVIGAKEREVSKRVSYALSLVGLSSKAKVYPGELSGGEQQRVALARALVNDAKVIIADEPTGNIDPQMSYEIVDLLNHINRTNGTTVIMVTHEHELVRKFDNRIIMIRNGTLFSDTAHPEFVPDKEDMLEEPVITGGYYDLPSAQANIPPAVGVGSTAEAKIDVSALPSAPAEVITSDVSPIPVNPAARRITADDIKNSERPSGKPEEGKFSKYFENRDPSEGGIS
ncbi:MAG: cell division ATP-binding protein FtsE [Clostridia bacterium]|nr:cell division ATP-binding protein FtsE [Clostridia bacterium]MBQ9880507.1 cell division ATP-binding protein FtsE [Clostridia bacterium]MCR5689486.1 cell division ATP-binding protein FtsE [Clostridiales bacterium]